MLYKQTHFNRIELQPVIDEIGLVRFFTPALMARPAFNSQKGLVQVQQYAVDGIIY